MANFSDHSEASRQVSSQDGKDFAADIGALYYETVGNTVDSTIVDAFNETTK
jgi:hypothetical protein